MHGQITEQQLTEQQFLSEMVKFRDRYPKSLLDEQIKRIFDEYNKNHYDTLFVGCKKTYSQFEVAMFILLVELTYLAEQQEIRLGELDIFDPAMAPNLL